MIHSLLDFPSRSLPLLILPLRVFTEERLGAYSHDCMIYWPILCSEECGSAGLMRVEFHNLISA